MSVRNLITLRARIKNISMKKLKVVVIETNGIGVLRLFSVLLDESNLIYVNASDAVGLSQNYIIYIKYSCKNYTLKKSF